jgi:colanic acid/amylovoran biosynthesis glycosyltransferase
MERTLNVGIVVGVFPEVSQTFIFSQIAGLRDAGADVTVFSIWGRPENPTANNAVLDDYDLPARTRYSKATPPDFAARIASCLDLFRSSFRSRLTDGLSLLNPIAHGRQAATLRLIHQSSAFLGAPDLDVVHCQFGDLALPIIAMLDAGIIDARLIVQFRGYDFGRVIKTHGISFYDPVFRRADLILPDSGFLAERLIEFGAPADRVRVHYNGVDTELFRPPRLPRTAESVPRIGFVGRLVEKKGLEYALEALGALAKTGYNFDFDIVGDGPLLEPLRAQTENLGIGRRIHFHGSLKHPEIIRILDACEVFLSPCVIASDGDIDSAPSTIKEAMAMGLPVVSTDISAIPEIIDTGVDGLLVPERQAPPLAEALAALLDSVELRQRLGQAAREKIEAKFSEPQAIKALLEIYDTLTEA